MPKIHRASCATFAKAARKAITHIVAGGAAAFALGVASAASSSNYVTPVNVIDAGIATAVSNNYVLSSSVGEAVFPLRSASANYRMTSGFWGAVVGLRLGCVLDVDGDQTVDALTDGLILLRAMLGLTGPALVAGAIGPTAVRTSADQVQPFVHLAALDLDLDGSVVASSDGVMLLRAMFGVRGNAVTSGAVIGGRSWPDIRDYVNTECGVTWMP